MNNQIIDATIKAVALPLTGRNAWLPGDDPEARWDAFTECLRDRIREIVTDGHTIERCWIDPEREDGLRYVRVFLVGEEPIEFYL